MSALVNCLLGAPYLADEEHYLLVCYADGRSVIEPGPALIRFSGWSHARIELLKHERHVASEAQCVTVVYRDGRSERRLGPCVVTRDPFQHERIEVQKLPRYIATADQHMLVQLRSGETLLRRGPLELVMDPLVHEKLSVSAIQRHVADPTQYLVILYRDGRKENLRGPVEVVQNPFVHLSIEVFASHRLSANEALVVYRRRGAFPPGPEGGNGGGGGGEWKKGGPVEATPAGSPFALIALAGDPNGPTPGGSGSQPGALGVERRLVHGPAVFSPNSTEWLHTFSWHGSVKDGKGSKTGYAGDVKVPHALSFQVLRCMPDQMYYSVRDVRTSDDASMTVHLMLFYELKQLETMLDSTNDMIGDMCNATSADVIQFASSHTYEQFLQRTSELSALDSFPILRSRVGQVGAELLKVVYRGYSATPQLQEMHDEAIIRRTQIRLDSDQAREEQEKRAMELRCRQERSVQEQQLTESETRSKLQVARLLKEQERAFADEEHKLRLRFDSERKQLEQTTARVEHDEELRRARELAEVQVSVVRAKYEQEKAKHEALHKLGVDLTAYLTALATARPDTHLRIDAGAGGAGGAPACVPNVHFTLGPPKPGQR